MTTTDVPSGPSRTTGSRVAARLGLRRRARLWMGASGAVLLTVAACVGINEGSAAADAHAPPGFPANCPQPQATPPGYPDPPPSSANPYVYNGHSYSGPIPLEVAFKGTIGSPGNAGGTITVPSEGSNIAGLIVPHVYGALCGVLNIPSLKGIITGNDVVLAGGDTRLGVPEPNVVNTYVGSQPQLHQAYPDALEALPLKVTFGTLRPSVDPTPAHNGGLDVTVSGSTKAILNTSGPSSNPSVLGMSCPLSLSIPLTTRSSGTLEGQPVTGPFRGGVAMLVSSDFAVPTVNPSPSCPPAIAYAFNKTLGLPRPAGQATFVAPVTFDFELLKTVPYDANEPPTIGVTTP